MGWERKRGKIEEFNRLLRGATDTSFAFHVGDLAVLPTVRYCITLDSDTRLPRDVARQLIGIITHPLNRARFDPRVGRVTEGLRHSAAARQRDVPERGRIAVRPTLRRTHGRGPIHHCGIGHLPGPFRGRYLHRQGSLRRGRVHCRARGLGAGERAAVARPLRRSPRACRARLGRGARRRLSLERARARASPAPLDPRRLADPAVAVSVRSCATRLEAKHAADDQPLENPGQPPAQPRRARIAGATGGRLDDPSRSLLVLDDDRVGRRGVAAPALCSDDCSPGRASPNRSRSFYGICGATR